MLLGSEKVEDWTGLDSCTRYNPREPTIIRPGTNVEVEELSQSWRRISIAVLEPPI